MFIEDAMLLTESRNFFGDILITHARTHGLLGSMLNQNNLLIYGAIGLIIVVAAMFLVIGKPKSWFFSIGIAVAVAGLGSNLVDRLASPDGTILVFVDITRISYRIPIFNFADILVAIGIFLAVIGILLTIIKKKKLSGEDTEIIHASERFAENRPRGGFIIGDLAGNSLAKKPAQPSPFTTKDNAENVDDLINKFDKHFNERETVQTASAQPITPPAPSFEDVRLQMPATPPNTAEQHDFDFYADAAPPATTPNLIQSYNQFLQNQSPQNSQIAQDYNTPTSNRDTNQQSGEFNQSKIPPAEPKTSTPMQPQTQTANSDAEFLARARANSQHLAAQLNNQGNDFSPQQPPQTPANNSTQDTLNHVNHLIQSDNSAMREQTDNLSKLHADSENYRQKLAEIQRKYRARLEETKNTDHH